MSTHKLISLFTITLLCATSQIALAMENNPLFKRGGVSLQGRFTNAIANKDLNEICEILLAGATVKPYTPREINQIFNPNEPIHIYKLLSDNAASKKSFDALKQDYKAVENIEYLLNGVKLVKIPWVGYVPLTGKNIAIGLGVTVAILCAAGHKYFYDCHLKRDNNVDETNQNDSTTAEGDTQNQKPVPAENA